METAEQFLKDKNIKTYGAIICDGQQLVELLTAFAQKQASFISSKQDVIKSVCNHNYWKYPKWQKNCTKCGEPKESS